MIIVGFVLLAAAAVIAVALVIQNPATVTVHAFTWSWDVDMRWLFVAGLALTAIGLLGLAMMRLGSARYVRLRRERRALAVENERLMKRTGADERRPVHSEHMPARRPVAGPPAQPAPMTQPAQPAQPAPTSQPSGPPNPPNPPMAPATGSVAAPERTAETSTHRVGLRERLAASRHRREKE